MQSDQESLQSLPNPELPRTGPSKVFIILIVSILIVITGIGAYFLGMNTQTYPQPQYPLVIQTTPTPVIDQMTNRTTDTNTSTEITSTTLTPGMTIKDGQTQQLLIPGGMTFTKPADWTVFALSPSATAKSTFPVQIDITTPSTANGVIINVDRYNYDGKEDVAEWYNSTLASDHGGEITGVESFGTTHMNAVVLKGSGEKAYTAYYIANNTNIFGIVVSDSDAHNNQEAKDFIKSISFK